MKILSGPILTLAGGSLVLAMCACSRTELTGSPPPANDYTTNAPSGSGGHGGTPYFWLMNHGYQTGTGNGFVAPDGRSVSQAQALSESGYARAGGSSTSTGTSEGTATRGGFGSTGESSGAHASGSHGGGGE